jgi:hypothetical protein
LSGNNHTATSALYLLYIAGGAESEGRIDDAKVMPPQPAKDTTDSNWFFCHGVVAALLRLK